MSRTLRPLLVTAGAAISLGACSPAAGPAPVALSVRAAVRGETLQILGSSSAPDGAWIVYAAYSSAHPETQASGSMQVEHGRFAARTDVSTWPHGAIGVDVNFQMGPPSPTQPRAVIARFGRNGERMTGPNVVLQGDASRAAVASTTTVKP